MAAPANCLKCAAKPVAGGTPRRVSERFPTMSHDAEPGDAQPPEIPSLAEALAEIRRLRVRIMEYEAQAAVAHGTRAKPTEDEPAAYTHNVPPNAPPHDE